MKKKKKKKKGGSCLSYKKRPLGVKGGPSTNRGEKGLSLLKGKRILAGKKGFIKSSNEGEPHKGH